LPRTGDLYFTQAARPGNNYRNLRQCGNNRVAFQSPTADYRRLAGEHALDVAATVQHTLDNHVSAGNTVNDDVIADPSWIKLSTMPSLRAQRSNLVRSRSADRDCFVAPLLAMTD
jgi:hypothetical protein